METLLRSLSACRLMVRFFAEEPVSMKHWIGAVLRNNFLYAAESIKDVQGISLRQIIETLPLPEDHFLYRQLKGGFPKGFFFDCSDLPAEARGFTLDANRIYTFSMVLIGNQSKYKPLYVEALRQMITRGFGHPVVSMTLIDITEISSRSEPDPVAESATVNVQLHFKTPVCLMHPSKKSVEGYQGKLNNFPSFYQFMRSLTYRLVTLCILYAECRRFDTRDEMDNRIEQWISSSVEAILLRADIQYERLLSTPKTDNDTLYSMGGYTGRLIFGDVPSVFFPVLSEGSTFGVGGEINYGLGQYEVTIQAGRPQRKERMHPLR